MKQELKTSKNKENGEKVLYKFRIISDYDI